MKISGGLSTPLKVKQHVKQGCPPSSMLYALAIEPLPHKICCELPGLYISNYENCLHLPAYADDVFLFISNENDGRLHGKKTVRDFEYISSAKVNWSKSEALLVGKWDSSYQDECHGKQRD